MLRGLATPMPFPRAVGALTAITLLSAGALAQSSTPFTPGTEFKDCAACPVMVVLPQQAFMMGSPEDEKGRSKNEGPQRKVTIGYPLAVGKFEVTFDEWDACLAETGCRGGRTERQGKERGTRPVTHVDWSDAQAFVKWLSAKTNMKYRLLSEAEWEYAARAGASTQYSWDSAPRRDRANYGMDECCGGFVEGADQWELAAPVGSFPPNAFGLHDLSGNLWE
ncbi:MAG: formylglycine-generating enzyme family protein [Rhodospirillaceae bacterium]|nr:formylglycine-generating enzyme family protein [Rhodospirillaceae bacterium]